MMFTIHFTFPKREAANLDRVNEALAGMTMSSAAIEAVDCSVIITTLYDSVTHEELEKEYCMVFDKLTLNCETDGGEAVDTWQIETLAYRTGEADDSDVFRDMWYREHPDRVMRVMRAYEFSCGPAYVIMHHKKIGA